MKNVHAGKKGPGRRAPVIRPMQWEAEKLARWLAGRRHDKRDASVEGNARRYLARYESAGFTPTRRRGSRT